MKYDAEFWKTRSVQKCAQNAGSNVLNEYHITFLQFSCALTLDYLAYILRGKLNNLDLILIVQNDNM